MAQRDPWAWIRAARAQAHIEHDGVDRQGRPCRRRLTALEAHVLLLFATYADLDTGICRPSIPVLARDSSRKVTGGGNSDVSKAIRGLEDLRLIWRRGRGRGKASSTKLLFDPDLRYSGCETSAIADTDVPRDGQGKSQKKNDKQPGDALRYSGGRPAPLRNQRGNGQLVPLGVIAAARSDELQGAVEGG